MNVACWSIINSEEQSQLSGLIFYKLVQEIMSLWARFRIWLCHEPNTGGRTSWWGKNSLTHWNDHTHRNFNFSLEPFIPCVSLAGMAEFPLYQEHSQRSRTANGRTPGHKPTRVRTVLTEKQLYLLKTCYAANPRPNAQVNEQLVEMTGLSPRSVRVWFQNKRYKDKRKIQLLQCSSSTEQTVCWEVFIVKLVHNTFSRATHIAWTALPSNS